MIWPQCQPYLTPTFLSLRTLLLSMQSGTSEKHRIGEVRSQLAAAVTTPASAAEGPELPSGA
jgi:hypothetical protein